MSTTARSAGSGRRRPVAAPPVAAKPTGRALRAAAQRESTAHYSQPQPGFLSHFSGPIAATPPTWLPWATLLLCILGLGVSIYLTVDHFAKIQLVCSDTGLVNCQKVTTSAQSHFLGIPVALLGLLFFVGMISVSVPAAWRVQDRRIHIVRLAMTVVGMCFVLYLLSAELLIIKNICLWCTSVHVLTFLLFVLMMATIPRIVGWTGTSWTETGATQTDSTQTSWTGSPAETA